MNIYDVIKKEKFRCAACKSESLKYANDALGCDHCGSSFPIRNSQIVFTALSDCSDSRQYGSAIFKYIEKHNGLLHLFKFIFSPVYLGGHLQNFMKQHPQQPDALSVNIGSGPYDYQNKLINIDMVPYRNVDIVCDLFNLPFRDNSVDVLVNIAVLEHTKSPEKAISEFFRVLKPGGLIYTMYPFIQGYHAAPQDYSRLTADGLINLHRDFEIIKHENAGGPTSGFLWVFQVWLAIMLSFGIKLLYYLLYYALMLFTFPIKYLDRLLNRHPYAFKISSGFVCVAKKPPMS